MEGKYWFDDLLQPKTNMPEGWELDPKDFNGLKIRRAVFPVNHITGETTCIDNTSNFMPDDELLSLIKKFGWDKIPPEFKQTSEDVHAYLQARVVFSADDETFDKDDFSL